MTRRKVTHRAPCSFEGCKEVGHFEFDTQREYREHLQRESPWRCVRHSRPEEVLALDTQMRAVTLTASRVESRFTKGGYLDGLFWKAEGRSAGSGLAYGPGFKAYASDFPEGTRLTVVARVDYPEATS